MNWSDISGPTSANDEPRRGVRFSAKVARKSLLSMLRAYHGRVEKSGRSGTPGIEALSKKWQSMGLLCFATGNKWGCVSAALLNAVFLLSGLYASIELKEWMCDVLDLGFSRKGNMALR